MATARPCFDMRAGRSPDGSSSVRNPHAGSRLKSGQLALEKTVALFNLIEAHQMPKAHARLSAGYGIGEDQ